MLIMVLCSIAILAFRSSILASTQSVNRWPRITPRQLIVYYLGHFSTSFAEGKNSPTSGNFDANFSISCTFRDSYRGTAMCLTPWPSMI